MILTMNINDNKSSQSHPGPTWQLPSYQLDYISDLSITLFNISLKHMQTHAWHTFWPAPLNQICSECVCVHLCLQEGCCSVWRQILRWSRRYRTHRSRPDQATAAPTSSWASETSRIKHTWCADRIVHVQCLCVTIPLNTAPFLVLWRLWCSSALCFQPAEATSPPFPKKHHTNVKMWVKSNDD